MNKYYRKFLVDAEKVSNNLKHRKTIKYNMSKYDASVLQGKLKYKNIEKAKDYIANRKRVALSELDKYLLQFEEQISKRGVEVLWATDSKEACDFITEIIEKHNCKLIVKSKSMTTEEIEFNEHVESIGIQFVETDLGEYIVQVAGEKPYHIVTPAMHKSKIDVNELFHEKFDLDINLSAEELTNYVRVKLRALYQQAEIGVTGANFIISDIGAIAVTENEGNALMTTSFPKVHIAIAGIEKVLPTLSDLDKFWPTLAVHATGQSISVYNTIFTGPKKDNEDFGPEKMYVILLDNKRTELLKQAIQHDSLACIRCGACLNVCPVYKNIGGYSYNATYSGPIGSIISPFYLGFYKSAHLSYACSICGKCTEVCPSKIDIHMLLLHNRNMEVDNCKRNKVFSFFIGIFKLLALNVSLFDMGFNGIKNLFLKTIGKNIFGKNRELPTFKKSFRKSYKQSN